MNLNTLELTFNKNEIEIYSTTYDKDKFNTLKNKYSEYSFYRDGNNTFCWPLTHKVEDEIVNTFQKTKITFENNSLIFCSIVENAIVTFFKGRNRPIIKPKYSSHWEVQLTENKSFYGLDALTILNFGVNTLYSVKQKKQFCILSLRLSQRYNFTLDDNGFKSRNIDTRGWKRNYDGTKIAGSRDNVANFIKVTNQKNEFDTFYNSTNSDLYGYSKLISFQNHFNNTINKDLILPDGLSILDFKLNLLPNTYLEASEINKPKYYFYNNSPHSTGYYQDSIKNLKPTTFGFFNNKHLEINIITPSTYEGTVEIFAQKILKELKETYHLDKLTIEIKPFDKTSLSYTDYINSIDFSGICLTIVVVSQNDKALGVTGSAPYYVSKAKLLNQKIPTQEVTIESIRKNDKIIESAIALNIYSKIGGTAWTIEKNEKDKVEVIIGVSSTIDFDKNRLMGFASVFDFDGSYLIGDCSPLSTKENYQENLQKYLISSIAEVIKEKAIEKGESIRLIFHLSKEAGKKNEIMAIEKALDFFRDYNIQFGIVHLSFNHNYRVYDNEGKTEIKRGTFIQISTFQALLHLGTKTKIPILVRLDKRSTFKDIYEITRQVFYFTHLCYRNLRPANVPVTIKYPSLMAKLTSELKQVPNWDYAQLNHIKDKLWFI